jgi:hemoglobin/transferrin/lactoferrin receptor protein
MAKTRYQPNEVFDLVIAGHYSTTSNIPRYDRLIQARDSMPRYSTWEYGPQEWFLGSATANFNVRNDAWDRVQIIAGFQQFTESRIDRRYQNANRRTREEMVNAYNLNFDFDKVINGKHTLYYGLEGVHNQVQSEATTTNLNTGISSSTATRYPDGGSYWTSAAAYITYKLDFNKKLSFNTGLRYTYITMQSKFIDTTYYDFPYDEISLSTSALNGSFIGVTYKPNKKWNFSLNTASGFRAPNIDDLSKVFDSEPGKVVLPNPELSPEYSYNTELSISRELSYKGKVELVGFYTYLVDAMVRRKSTFNGQDSIMYDGELSEVQMITNAGRAHIYGASLNLRANITRKIGLVQTFTWNVGRDLEKDVPLRHVAPAFGRSSVFFKSDKLRTEFFSQYNAWRHWDDLAPEEQGKPHLYTEDGTPAWFTINIRTAYQFNETLELSGALENILDQHYRPYSSGISAAGINFILALRAKF